MSNRFRFRATFPVSYYDEKGNDKDIKLTIYDIAVYSGGEKREVYFRDGGFRLKPTDTKLGRGHWLEQTSALEIIGNVHTEQKD